MIDLGHRIQAAIFNLSAKADCDAVKRSGAARSGPIVDFGYGRTPIIAVKAEPDRVPRIKGISKH
jgi:hypothetical protein